MTLSTIATTTSAVGAGNANPIAVPFQFLAPGELEVRERDSAGNETLKILGTHYNVTGGGGTVGTVTPLAAIPVGVTWWIRRITTQTQATDYVPNDTFPASSHELALDRLTMIAQELQTLASRAVRAPVSEAALNTMPSITARAGLFLAFDGAGQPIAATPADPSALHRPINPPVAVTEGGTGAPDAATARANLGLRPGIEIMAFDATLAAMAALATVADRIIFWTGVDSAQLTTLTAFMRTLLDDVDAATARATLGISAGATRPFSPPVDITEGGTNAVTAANARANLAVQPGVDVQAFSALLASIAGLSTQADRAFYTTAANAAALFILTSFGRSLLDDIDAATARGTLGVRPGIDVQGFDAMLAAYAALNTTSDQLAYFTGPDQVALTPLTGFMRTLLDDANQAAAQATLGITGGVTRPISPAVDVTEGGTNATTAVNARANLGLRINTDVQAFSTLLLAFSLVSTGADRMPYFFGVDQVDSTPLTAFARTLLDDNSASTMRATLGAASTLDELGDVTVAAPVDLQFLQFDQPSGQWVNRSITIGAGGLDSLTDVTITSVQDTQILQYSSTLGLWVNVTPTTTGPFQPLDATLTALGGLATAADRLPYFTGADLAALTVFTSFARTLLDDVDAAAMRATLGAQAAGSYQSADATLSALAGLGTSADQLPYFTGVDVAALTAFTSFARTLLDDADAATMRATLGLVIGTNVQAFDAELAAIAGLTSAADQVPYFTGSGTASLATVTAAARTVLDDTTVAAMLATLGGQPSDAELTAIAGLVSAADRLPYFTGSGTASLATFTAFARTLLDDTNAAGMQTTLGLVIGTDVQAFNANYARTDVASSWTKPQRYPWVGITDQATLAWDCDAAINASVTVAANRTMGLPTNIRDGQIVAVKVGASGAFSVTSWNAAFDFGTAGAPAASATSGKFDVYSFIGVGTTKLNFIGFTKGCSQ